MEVLMGNYEVQLEISGPTAMWTRPDSGDCPVSYPVPTYSAVKGIFEAILFIQAVEIVPRRVEICAPVVFHTYNTNYGGPLRKSDQMNKGASYQLVASVLANPCYRFYADVRRNDRTNSGVSRKTEDWLKRTTSPPHAYQEIFNRRLRRGQSHYIPCLGWKEFTPDYVGPFRLETQVCTDINMTLPTMLRQIFPDGLNSGVRFIYDQKVKISNGVLEFGEAGYAQ
jgi:CRISPR-associated protein Cas5d